MDKEVRDEETMSGIKVGHRWGHSCLRIYCCRQKRWCQFILSFYSFLRTYLNQRHIELAQVSLFSAQKCLIARLRNDSLNDKVPNPWKRKKIKQSVLTSACNLSKSDYLPCCWSWGSTFHLVAMSLSRICKAMYCGGRVSVMNLMICIACHLWLTLVCVLLDCCKMAGTRCQASGCSWNWGKTWTAIFCWFVGKSKVVCQSRVSPLYKESNRLTSGPVPVNMATTTRSSRPMSRSWLKSSIFCDTKRWTLSALIRLKDALMFELTSILCTLDRVDVFVTGWTNWGGRQSEVLEQIRSSAGDLEKWEIRSVTHRNFGWFSRCLFQTSSLMYVEIYEAVLALLASDYQCRAIEPDRVISLLSQHKVTKDERARKAAKRKPANRQGPSSRLRMQFATKKETMHLPKKASATKVSSTWILFFKASTWQLERARSQTPSTNSEFSGGIFTLLLPRTVSSGCWNCMKKDWDICTPLRSMLCLYS